MYSGSSEHRERERDNFPPESDNVSQSRMDGKEDRAERTKIQEVPIVAWRLHLRDGTPSFPFLRTIAISLTAVAEAADAASSVEAAGRPPNSNYASFFL